MQDNVILELSLDFAERIVKLHIYLRDKKREYVMSKQLLRAGTSIGANAHEAVYGQSPKDFISKFSIALKESAETMYWLRLLHRTKYITTEQFNSISKDCAELIKILTAIVKTTKQQGDF